MFYRRNLPHLQRDDKPHFVTFISKHRCILPDWARDLVLGCCTHDHGLRYDLHVVVVMPEHVHLILSPMVSVERQRVILLFEIMQGIKGASARAINLRLQRHGKVWQEESFDHVVRSSEGLDAKVEYVLENPVRRGLVSDWRQYRWTWRKPEKNPFAP